MGLFSFLVDSFKSGYAAGQQKRPVSSRSPHSFPHTMDLFYPAPLLRFDEIASGGHNDPRAAVYTMLCLDVHRKRPFPDGELSALDFGGCGAAYRVLLEKGLIQEPGRDVVLVSLFSGDELRAFLRDRNLSVSGSKQELAKRLLGNGFKIDGRKYRRKLFFLTESGVAAISQYRSDERQAIALATKALKESDYSGAISAYRSFDSRWGFVHTSGKNHTIFACPFQPVRIYRQLLYV